MEFLSKAIRRVEYCRKDYSHIYADDTQVYQSFRLLYLQTALKKRNNNLNRLTEYCFRPFSNLKSQKTIAFVPKNLSHVVENNLLFEVRGEQINTVQSVNILGAIPE